MDVTRTPTSQTIVTTTSITETRLMWGMPITVQIAGPTHADGVEAVGGKNPARGIQMVFDYFAYIDDKFSTYKSNSEISQINRGVLSLDEATLDMRTVFALAEEMRQETGGYFDIRHDGKVDPSGLVKGWAISNAADMLRDAGYAHFYVEAGGDFQVAGLSPQGRPQGKPWRAGIRSPFNPDEIVKVLAVSDRGVATSGTYARGKHIYNPVGDGSEGDDSPLDEILSITIIGPDVYEADCYATAAFAMGRSGIDFIESMEGFEGYMIDKNRQATFTSGFERYVDYAAD